MPLEIKSIVENYLASFGDWKPFGWGQNDQGKFEKKYTNHVKQIVSPGFKSIEVMDKNFFVVLCKDFHSQPLKNVPVYMVEIRDKKKEKLIYSQKKQDTTFTEEGNAEEAQVILKKVLTLIHDSDKMASIVRKKECQRG